MPSSFGRAVAACVTRTSNGVVKAAAQAPASRPAKQSEAESGTAAPIAAKKGAMCNCACLYAAICSPPIGTSR